MLEKYPDMEPLTDMMSQGCSVNKSWDTEYSLYSVEWRSRYGPAAAQ